MSARIFSRVFCRVSTLAVLTTATTVISSSASAQSGAGFYTDPSTGIVYQRVTKTIERPVVETKTETRDQTIYRPQTITEVKPESRTVYTPVVEYKWEPRVHGRWNPFQKTTVAYHHVPNARWEARNEVVERTNTRTEWVAEKRTIEVPQRVVRMEREQQVNYEPVGRVAPQQHGGPAAANSQIASRLRPLDTGTRIDSFGPRIATNTLGRMTSDPPRRSIDQGGLRPTTLHPNVSDVRGQALPPVSSGVGVANLPSIPFFR